MLGFYYINKSYIYNQNIDWRAPVLYGWINICLIKIYGIDFCSAGYDGGFQHYGPLLNPQAEYFPDSTPFTASMFFAINENT